MCSYHHGAIWRTAAAQAVVANSGNANACAPQRHGERQGACARRRPRPLGLKPADLIVASTGVIGQELNIDAIEPGMPRRPAASCAEDGSDDAAHAIMTTDTVKEGDAPVESSPGRQDRAPGRRSPRAAA